MALMNSSRTKLIQALHQTPLIFLEGVARETTETVSRVVKTVTAGLVEFLGGTRD